MVRSVSRRSRVSVASTLLAFGLVAMSPGVSAGFDPDAALLSHSQLFQGAAIEWVWTVRGDATLEDGNHIDTGHLQIAVECLNDGRCTSSFTFLGGLGTATCSQTAGVVTGHMELYAGPSFDCATMSVHMVGLGACEASLNARGVEMGTHRLAGTGGGVGICVSPG